VVGLGRLISGLGPEAMAKVRPEFQQVIAQAENGFPWQTPASGVPYRRFFVFLVIMSLLIPYLCRPFKSATGSV
jgi:hypothetical protein